MRITNKIKEDYEKLKKATKRKVRNTVKNQGAIIHDIQNGEVVSYDIRTKLNIPSLESFKTKKDFDEWSYEQRKFTSGRSPHFKFFKNEHGTVFTDYAKIVLENKEAKAQKEAEKEREKVADKPFVKGHGTVEQNLMLMNRPKALGFNKIKIDFNFLWNKADIERKLTGLTVKGSPDYYLEKKQTMKENFASLIEQSFNSDGVALANMIRDISPEDFYEIYMSYNWDFDYVYENHRRT
jgi:hypothetical protein